MENWLWSIYIFLWDTGIWNALENWHFQVWFINSKKYFIAPKSKTPSFPWSQQTVLGWISELTFGIIITAIFLLINTAFISFFIAICVNHQAFYEFFRAMINNVYEEAYSMNLNRKSRSRDMLCSAIRFHITIKEWVLSITAKRRVRTNNYWILFDFSVVYSCSQLKCTVISYWFCYCRVWSCWRPHFSKWIWYIFEPEQFQLTSYI